MFLWYVPSPHLYDNGERTGALLSLSGRSESRRGDYAMKAPFPYFGGKSMVADEVWARFGDVRNFCEPFFGSGAVLLARPDAHEWWDRIETVNDADGLLANFWRATKLDPDAVAEAADHPVTECDLHARHLWLVGRKTDLTARLMGDPEWFDAKAAGWWLWGICSWIGSGWCSGDGPWVERDGLMVNSRDGDRPAESDGVKRQLPHLGDAGRGQCAEWSAHTRQTMRDLADRLRRVRVCCGDWSRICGPTPTVKQGLTAVVLDPPYSVADRAEVYSTDSFRVAGDVRVWALAHGDDPRMRICLAGYDGEHDMPGWTVVEWKARGGYESQSDDPSGNCRRERLWFSPHCLRIDAPRQGTLFDAMTEEEPAR